MKKKMDWYTALWLLCLAAIFFLFGRLSADMTLLVNAGQVAPVQHNYNSICEEVGAQYNICPELLEAMIEQESGGNTDAVSAGGDTGLMQVNPKWHRDRMDRLGVTDLTDPYSNVLTAADYIAELAAKYDDLPMTLMVYNGTADAKERWTNGDFTDYANQIMQRTAELERKHGK